MTGPPRKVRIDLSYDGTDFAGWQLQPGLRTVQGELERALSELHGGRLVRARGAGRTDAGVHARGQVADATVECGWADDDLGYRLGCLLPSDVRPTSVATVDEAFGARESATGKTYAYRLDLSRHGDPFERRYALHVPGRFDRDRVERGLARLPGRRDWSGFAARGCTVESPVRTLTEARLERCGAEMSQLAFSADGFLTHMVRTLVGTVLEIARGRFEPERIDEVLASRQRELAGPTAPAKGLWLERVHY